MHIFKINGLARLHNGDKPAPSLGFKLLIQFARNFLSVLYCPFPEATPLISGQGWFADPELIARVLKKCVGESMCKRLKDDAGRAVTPYQLNPPHLTMPSIGTAAVGIGVAQYGTRSLKLFEAKISQFPPGSKFFLGRWYRPSNGCSPLEARRDIGISSLN
jgi:hypothetical protein